MRKKWGPLSLVCVQNKKPELDRSPVHRDHKKLTDVLFIMKNPSPPPPPYSPPLAQAEFVHIKSPTYLPSVTSNTDTKAINGQFLQLCQDKKYKKLHLKNVAFV